MTLWIGESEFETQGDLAAFLGGSGALRFDYHDGIGYEPEMCLCPVDVARTMVAAGYDVKRDSWGDFRARKRPALP